MRGAHNITVPATFLIALVAVLAMTVSWVPHPVQPTRMVVDLGPGGLVPGRSYGLSFTPRNSISGHILTRMVPDHGPCADVTVTDIGLTFFDRLKACRVDNGSYKTVYTFPAADDYVLFVELHPVGGIAQTARVVRLLDKCSLYGRPPCPPRAPALRGQEVVRSHTADGLTVVLGAPVAAISAGEYMQISCVFLRGGRAVTGIQTTGGPPGAAAAISSDTRYFTRLDPVPTPAGGTQNVTGAVTFSGRFDTPAIYRLFGLFRYRGHPIKTSFTIDVNPAPSPTPSD